MITVHIIYMIILESFLPGSEPPIFTKLYDFCILDAQLCLLSNSMKQVVVWLLSLYPQTVSSSGGLTPVGLSSPSTLSYVSSVKQLHDSCVFQTFCLSKTMMCSMFVVSKSSLGLCCIDIQVCMMSPPSVCSSPFSTFFIQ